MFKNNILAGQSSEVHIFGKEKWIPGLLRSLIPNISVFQNSKDEFKMADIRDKNVF